MDLKKYFSKQETVSQLFNEILVKSKMLNLSPEDKKYIFQNVFNKHMKIAYGSLEPNKINQSNYKMVMQQYIKYVIDSSVADILQNNYYTEPNISKFKSMRDMAIPNRGNMVDERPQITLRNPIDKTQNMSHLGDYYAPLINSNNTSFNEVSIGKGSQEVKKNMEILMNMRDTEIMINKNKPSMLPPQLIPMETNVRGHSDPIDLPHNTNKPASMNAYNDESNVFTLTTLDDANSINNLGSANDEFATNIHDLDKKKDDIGEINKFEVIKQKLLLPYIKEIERLTNILKSTKLIQLDIQGTESDNVFKLNNVIPIRSIRLNSYSIPEPIYNIEQNKNNMLYVEINDQIIKYQLNNGKYDINKILDAFNNMNNSILHFELNDEQKIKISSEHKFIIKQTPLSVENFGFLSESSNNIHIADKIWNLQINKNIYIFITNVSENPYSILSPNGLSSGFIEFNEPLTLDKLELTFTDSKRRKHNFYGLNYNIILQLT